MESQVVHEGSAQAQLPAPTRVERRVVYETVKRLLDVVVAVVALVVTAPIVLVAIVAICIDSPGPVFFRQIRMGRNGRSFSLLKLRGMYVDAGERFPELYDYSGGSIERRDAYYFHDAGDPRVTRVGRIIRRFSIDELPNFVNVLVGDMSVVGPRPEIPELAHLYGTDLEKLLSIRPGVTSPAKAAGRDSLSFSETLASDLDYVDRRSLRLDLRVILQTFWNATRGHGVRD